MDAGLRGYSVGDAQVSEKHCGFVVNRGSATASEVLQLVADVREKVRGLFGVELEPEIKIIGD
jgi:UDP-N-acetylmuramate dehydrogenase